MERIVKPFLDNHIQALLHEQLAALQLLRCASTCSACGVEKCTKVHLSLQAHHVSKKAFKGSLPEVCFMLPE